MTKKGTEISIFVNGLLESTNTVPAVSAVKASTSPISIGSPYEYVGSASDYSYRGYISNVRIVKGTAVYEDDFVPTFEPLEAINGTVLLCCNSSTSPTEAVVSPTALTTNGTVGATNFSPFIDNLLQMQGPENNYAVLEATKIKTHSREVVEGLSITGDTSSAWNSFPGTMGSSSGKWYWEVYDKDGYFDIVAGAAQDGSFHMWDTDVYVGQNSYGNSWGIMNNGTLYVNGTQTGSYFPAFAGSSIQYSTLGFALDMDSGKAYISLDGRWGSDAAPHTNAQISDGSATPAVSGLTGTYRPVISANGGTTSTRRLDVNFGQRPFRFTPPEGYKCWNRTNLPTPEKAARNATKNFQTLIWTGDGVSPKTRTGLNFKPDFIWIKERNQSYSIGHRLYDSVRGAGVNKHLDSSTDRSEGYGNDEDYGYVTGFVEGGFTTINGGSGSDYVNNSSNNYVAWCWKAGGTPNKTYTVKVVSDSGNKYRFDDFGTSTVTLDLEEGGTYVFDQSDSSNGPHPLRFSTTSDGIHGGGSEYTTGVVTEGVPGNPGAKTTITVAAGAPTLYYYCSAHPGMGGQSNTNTTRGSSNFAGSIQSKVSANTDAGFSIVKYTGSNSAATFGHGLNSAPEMIIIKNRDGNYNWFVYHKDVDATAPEDWYMMLDVDDARRAAGNAFNSTAPDSSVVHVGAVTETNGSGNNLVAYCFHSVEGYCKVGGYIGNGDASGPVIYTDFKPAFVMTKRVDSNFGGEWSIFDNARNTTNPNNYILAPDLPNTETTASMDFLSNGFKLRMAGNWQNQGGGEYIYLAFAEAPTNAGFGAVVNAR